MRMLRLLPLLLACAAVALQAETTARTPARVMVGPMKTGIYVGSVTLTLTPLVRKGDGFESSYEAEVFPWFFWGESGPITIKLPQDDLDRLARRETVEFTGDAANEKGKPRTITGRAQPADATSGKIKVRIMADGIELIFNGTYEFANDA